MHDGTFKNQQKYESIMKKLDKNGQTSSTAFENPPLEQPLVFLWKPFAKNVLAKLFSLLDLLTLIVIGQSNPGSRIF